MFGKTPKPDFSKSMTKDESRKYYQVQLENAKKKLEEKIKMGDERGAKRAAEIINNLEGLISRL